MKICYFGSYPLYYPRHQIITKGLQGQGVDIVQVQDNSSILIRYPKLLNKYLCADDYDALLVGEASNYVMPLAVLLKKLFKKPIIFDTFVSVYDTNLDRRTYNSPIVSKSLFWLDKFNCENSDVVLQGTEQDIFYFNQTFGIDIEKFQRLFIGADNDIFYPRETQRIANDDTFTVLFYGTYIPLHGIEYIIKAAKLLESHTDIKFQLIGSGQTLMDIENLCLSLKLNNVEFIKQFVEYGTLPSYISAASVGLGIFGGTTKANRVIPTKAFQIIAMKKPLITGNSPAAQEIFVNNENAILCNMADPRSLADAILQLKEDESLRNTVASNGFKTYQQRLTPSIIGLEMKNILDRLCL